MSWQTIEVEEVEDGSAAAFLIMDRGLPTERSYIVSIFSQIDSNEDNTPIICDRDMAAIAAELGVSFKRFNQ